VQEVRAPARATLGQLGPSDARWASIAAHMAGPWIPGCAVSYAISFYDGTTDRESPRSERVRIGCGRRVMSVSQEVWPP